MTIKKRHIFVFLLPTLILFCLIFLWPLVQLITTSSTSWIVGQQPVFNGFDNYIQLFTDSPNFLQSMLNTLFWILLQTTVHVIIGVLLALILAQKPFYWRFARTVYMIPNIISSAALAMMFVCILDPGFGAVNGLIRLITGNPTFQLYWFMNPNTAFGSITLTWLPYAATITLLVLTEILSIDSSITEAAIVDGANRLQLNIRIILPLTRNIIGTCEILAATSMLQRFDTIMMTTKGGPGNLTMNLPIFIYNTGLVENNLGRANTAGVLLLIIGIMFVLMIRRIFRMGEMYL